MPAGSHLTPAGGFLHARCLSMTSWDQNGVTASALTDVGINADEAATDPFVRGRSHRRSSPLLLDRARPPPPTSPAPGTRCAGVSGQSTQILISRVSFAVRGTGVTAANGLPSVSVTPADNSTVTVTGTKAGRSVREGKQLAPSPAIPMNVYLTLRGNDPTLPAQDPPVFRREFDVAAHVSGTYQASCGGTAALAPGQCSDPDNAYAVAMVDGGFAGGPVLVTRGKMPTAPTTCLDQPTMASSVDMRDRPLCQDESLATTKVAGCADDEQARVDAAGNYATVSSTTKDRPGRATTACGVVWPPRPENGDGAGDLNDGMLILRNPLPGPRSPLGTAGRDPAGPGGCDHGRPPPGRRLHDQGGVLHAFAPVSRYEPGGGRAVDPLRPATVGP